MPVARENFHIPRSLNLLHLSAKLESKLLEDIGETYNVSSTHRVPQPYSPDVSQTDLTSHISKTSAAHSSNPTPLPIAIHSRSLNDIPSYLKAVLGSLVSES